MYLATVLAALVAISGPKKVSISGPIPSKGLQMDIARMKIIMSRAI
jgi:hypothetical protein